MRHRPQHRRNYGARNSRATKSSGKGEVASWDSAYVYTPFPLTRMRVKNCFFTKPSRINIE
jgi:hypothetical protein